MVQQVSETVYAKRVGSCQEICCDGNSIAKEETRKGG